MGDNRICVLMSTYNGEKFIKEQIDSILSQDGVTVSILVRDDGSSDNTVSIVNSYSETADVRLLKSDRNLGPGLSFMDLIYNSEEYDYYAFADQDDIWKPDKLINAVKMISGIDEPALYCSNQMLYCDGTETGMRYKSEPNYSLANCICSNRIAGCTMVFNRKLRDILAEYRPDEEIIRQRMHDTWVMIMAWVFGKVVYDHNSYIDYRIHSNNTVGVKEVPFLKRLQKKLKNKDSLKGRSRISANVRKLLKQAGKQENTVIDCFAEYGSGFKNMMRLISNKDIVNNIDEKKIVFTVKTILKIN